MTTHFTKKRHATTKSKVNNHSTQNKDTKETRHEHVNSK